MARCKAKIAALAIVLGMICGGTAQAQCSITSTYIGMYMMGGMNVNFVQHYLSTSAQCTLTMSMSVIDCQPDPSASTTVLSATAYPTAASPACTWSCDCGTVSINASDGLPVELLDFDIDGE